jgi:hypothetical protein
MDNENEKGMNYWKKHYATGGKRITEEDREYVIPPRSAVDLLKLTNAYAEIRKNRKSKLN